MIIKKYNGTSWDNQTVKTTASDIFTDSSFATSIFDGNNKVKVAYLPDAVFDSLLYYGTIAANGSTNYTAGQIHQALASAASAGRSGVGSYFVVSTAGTLAAFTNTFATGYTSFYYTLQFKNQDGNATANSTSGLLEVGDWIVIDSVGSQTGASGDPIVVTMGVINNAYELATSTVNGIVQIGSDTTQTVNPVAVTSTASRTYATQKDSSGRLVVNVPWTDNNTTYSAGTGLTLSGTTFNANVDGTVQTVASNTVSATSSRTYAVQVDGSDNLVVNVPWTDTDTNTTYSAGVGLALSGTTFKANLIDETLRSVTAETITTTASRTYAVMPDADGDLVVNVPWTDTDTNTTYSKATSTVLGLVKLEDDAVQSTAANAITTTTGRTYGVQFNSSDQLVVNVPWTDTNTTYGEATTSTLGLVKLSFAKLLTAPTVTETTTSDRYYGVSLNSSGQMLVNVPWVDTNTTYSAGNGISLSSTTFSVAGGEGITQESSGVRMTYPLYVQTATPSTSVTNAIWYDIN